MARKRDGLILQHSQRTHAQIARNGRDCITIFHHN